MIDDRIKLLTEKAPHTPPARLQREIAALVEALVSEQPPLFIYHPFDAPVPIEEGVRKYIERLELQLSWLRTYAEEHGYADIVQIIDGPAIA